LSQNKTVTVLGSELAKCWPLREEHDTIQVILKNLEGYPDKDPKHNTVWFRYHVSTA